MRQGGRHSRFAQLAFVGMVHVSAFALLQFAAWYFGSEFASLRPTAPAAAAARMDAISRLLFSMPALIIGVSFAICLVYSLVGNPRVQMLRRGGERDRTGPRCLRCGYNRRGLRSGVNCPECGLPASGLAAPPRDRDMPDVGSTRDQQ